VTGAVGYDPVASSVVLSDVTGNTMQYETCNDTTVTFTGSGDSASWSGSFTCPPVAVNDCIQITLSPAVNNLVLTAGVLSYVQTGNATYASNSTHTYCGKTLPYTATFSNGMQ